MERATIQDPDLQAVCVSPQEGAKNGYPELTVLPSLLQSPADASVDLSQLEVRSKGAY